MERAVRRMRPRHMQRVVVLGAAVMFLATACIVESDTPTEGEAGERPDTASPTSAHVGDAAVWRVTRSTRLDASSTRFRAEVTRLACNSGVTGAVLAPTVEVVQTEIVVIYAVAADRPEGGDCQSNDWVPYLVDLGEPLGERALVDGECLSGDEAPTTSFCRRGGIRFP